MAEKRKIYFRADAGAEIGYGHYIRSMALADMLKQDFECTMFTQSPTEYQLREAENICSVVSLPCDDTKFDIFLEHLTGEEIVVLDNYFFTTDYQRAIKAKGCKLVCIDDMHDKHYVADVVINHCIEENSLFSKEPYTHLSLGSKYALLRAPFLKKQMVEKTIPWVVCFGGSDKYDFTRQSIYALREKGVESIIAIVGEAYAYKDELNQVEGVDVYSGLSALEIALFFAKSENVLCSASSICYEALSQGCTVYAGWYVDNQKEFYLSLLQQKYIVPLGNLNEDGIILREKNSLNELNIGLVVNRLRGLFIVLASRSYNYTDLSEQYSYEVWRTRNLPEIRTCMTNPEPFDFDNHMRFINHLFNDDSKLYKAWFFGNDFLASFNLVEIRKKVSANRGLFINPSYQSMNIATLIDLQVECLARELYDVRKLDAEVLKSNLKSYHYHIKNGYVLINEDQQYYYLTKYLV